MAIERQLSPLQLEGATKLSAPAKMSPQGRRCLFADMGTGKTPMASKAAADLCCRRILVTCKDNGVNVWRYDGAAWLEQFTGVKCHVHIMDEEPWNREIEWNTPTPKDELHLYICVYNTFANDMAVISKQGNLTKRIERAKRAAARKKIIKNSTGFDILIADECRRVSDRDTAAYLALRKLFVQHFVSYFIPLTGTPGHTPDDYWTYFNLIDPKKFGSFWAFAEHFMTVDEDPWGGRKLMEQRTDTKQEWDRLLNEYCFIIPEGTAKKPVERSLVIFDMDSDQRKLYEDLSKEMLHISEAGDVAFAQNSMVLFLRLRQALICPRILGPNFGVGGAIKHLVSTFKDYPEQAHTVIFTPFTDAFDHFTAYLRASGYPNVYHLRGGITPTEQQTRINAWRASKGIMLCTCKYAEAFSLEPVKTSWFIGSDEDPDVNRQAENRISRFTTVGDCYAGYYTANTPNDIRFQEIHAIKQAHINFAKPENIKAIVKGTI